MRYLVVFAYKGFNNGVWQIIDVRRNCEVVDEVKILPEAKELAEMYEEMSDAVDLVIESRQAA